MKKHVLRVLSSAAVVTTLLTSSVFTAESSATSVSNQENKAAESNTSKNIIKPRAIVNKAITKKVALDSQAGVNLAVTATYRVNDIYIYNLKSITSAITGTTANFTWTQTSYSETRLDANRTIQATIKGNLKQIQIVNGTTYVYTYPKTVTVEFYADDK